MRRHGCVRMMVIAVLLLFTGVVLKAQTQTGTISGTVTDTSGGVVVNAKIDVKNTDTGLTQSTVTDAQGRYTVPQLQVGNYEVTATATGFQTHVHTGITLTVGSQLVVDFSLQVGQVQQTVTVESQVTQVETTSSTVSTLVNQVQMAQLPLNGRNVEQLVLLSPGIQQYTTANQNTGYFGREAGYSVAGSRPLGQAFLLDDQNMADWFQRGIGDTTAGTSLGVEGIAEFQTLVNTYSAQFGGNGAAVNAVSKAGTNTFHGGAYEFVRNAALDARNFFNLPPFQNRQPFNRNQFGADLGGPVKKDKAFFFVNYEGLRQVLGVTNTFTTPNLNGWTAASGNAFYTGIKATDPVTIENITNTLALYQQKAPADCAAATCTLTEETPSPTSENYLLGRFDYTLSGSDSIFARYVLDRSTDINPFAGSTFVNGYPETDHDRNQFIILEERHIFSPTLINSARLSFSRTVVLGSTTSEPTVNTVYGSNIDPLAWNNGFVPYGLDGNVSIGGIGGLGPGSLSTGINDTQNKPTIGDDVIWTKGAHSFTFGTDLVRDDSNTLNLFQIGGSWTFANLNSFLAGSAASLSGTIPNSLAISEFGAPLYAHRDTRAWLVDPYVQDTWKVSARVTVNLGLRYNFMSNPLIRNGAGYNVLDPPNSCPAGVPQLAGTCQITNMWINGNPSRYDFDPRIGIAYDPFADHKTSIRAGFATFHSPVSEEAFVVALFQSPPEIFETQTPTSVSCNGKTQTIVPQYGYVFTTPCLPSLLKVGPGVDSRINVSPTQAQWNVSVQHDFAGTVLSVAYVGASGYNLIDELNQNTVSQATLAANGGAFDTLSAPTFAANGVPTGGTIIPDALENPNFSTLLMMETEGHSSYQSLQVGVNRRLTKGLTGQIAYTWSHCMDNGSVTYGLAGGNDGGNQNPYNLAADRGNCGFDIRNALRVNAVYTLPFRGNQAIEGWQVAGILTQSDGPWITPSDGVANILFGGGNGRPNVAASCSNGQSLIQNTGASTGTGIQWFNPTCFTPEAVGFPGNAGRTSIPGPGITNLDFSLIKDTKITRISENFDLQLRLEAFDVFNHPNFALPSASMFTGATGYKANGTPNISPAGGGAGVITSTIGNVATTTGGGQRLFQIGLKAIF